MTREKPAAKQPRPTSRARSEVGRATLRTRTMTAQTLSATPAAFVLDGKAISEEIRRPRRRGGARARRARRQAGAGGGSRRRRSRRARPMSPARARRRKACGFHSVQHDLPADAGEEELLALIERLNADPAIHGILVQLPLPKTILGDARAGASRPAEGRRRLPSRSTSASSRSANRIARSFPARRRAR